VTRNAAFLTRVLTRVQLAVRGTFKIVAEWEKIRFDLAKYRKVPAFTQATGSGDKEAIARAEKEWRASALVEVPALKAKTASRRFVQIRDNLAAWPEPRIGTGNVCPRNLRKLLEADRTAAGLRSWPSNALRHSFASYHLAHFRDAAKLALELGHGDQDLIFRHLPGIGEAGNGGEILGHSTGGANEFGGDPRIN
jgi:hypothetical protein